MEIYNFIITLPNKDADKRTRVTVQVMPMESGELKIISVNKNDDRVVAFDVMCLHRWVWLPSMSCVYLGGCGCLQCHVPT